ncbi:hypothetical protein PanWU01x14_359360 [Parasponia andersonii]|uniref:Uncharacterized protein n=1 Tax=Parasponia andersonii TaxID=3476 RepID=A0A2P5A803_PARAD|nr:hypothetical protein PanWU01x14_359360 [Parasponia andersonii]
MLGTKRPRQQHLAIALSVLRGQKGLYRSARQPELSVEAGKALATTTGCAKANKALVVLALRLIGTAGIRNSPQGCVKYAMAPLKWAMAPSGSRGGIGPPPKGHRATPFAA